MLHLNSFIIRLENIKTIKNTKTKENKIPGDCASNLNSNDKKKLYTFQKFDMKIKYSLGYNKKYKTDEHANSENIF